MCVLCLSLGLASSLLTFVYFVCVCGLLCPFHSSLTFIRVQAASLSLAHYPPLKLSVMETRDIPSPPSPSRRRLHFHPGSLGGAFPFLPTNWKHSITFSSYAALTFTTCCLHACLFFSPRTLYLSFTFSLCFLLTAHSYSPP